MLKRDVNGQQPRREFEMFNDKNTCINIEKVANGWIINVQPLQQGVHGKIYVAETAKILGGLIEQLAKDIKD